jgi:hypothetical protein
VLDTTVVLVIFLLFCVPDLSHDRERSDSPITFAERPLPHMLLQAALVLPL